MRYLIYIATAIAIMFSQIQEMQAQTTLKAMFQRVIRDENGVPITGLDVDLHLWNDTAKYVDLVEDTLSPGTYYKDSLEYGLYDLYIDGILNQSQIFHGANKMNLIANKFTNDLIQLVTEGIKDSAVTWEKLSEAVKDSIRKRRIGNIEWGDIVWGDLAEAVKDSIRKDDIGGSLPEDFLDTLLRGGHGIKITPMGASIILIGFDSTQAEKDTIFARIHPDSTTTGAARGNFFFDDNGCVKVYRIIAEDSLAFDTLIVCDTLSEAPLVVICDTTVGTRYIDKPDTIRFDASRCTGTTNTCLQEFTVPIFERQIHRYSVSVKDSLLLCDSICYKWITTVRDTLYYEFSATQINDLRLIQLQQLGIMCDTSRNSTGANANICLRLMPNGKWLANLKEGIVNYPHKFCPVGTKCDTTYVCCINKYIITQYMASRDLEPISYLWLDSTRITVDCQQNWGAPHIEKDSINCVYITRSLITTDTTYIDTGLDTTVVVNICDYACPKIRVVKGMDGYYDSTVYIMPVYDYINVGVDTVLINANYQTFWNLTNVNLQFVSPHPTKAPYWDWVYQQSRGLYKHELDSLLHIAGWTHLDDTVSVIYGGSYSDSGYFHLGMIPLNLGTILFTGSGWNYSNITYWNEITLSCYWTKPIWDATCNNANYHKYIYVWVFRDQLDSLISCSEPCDWWYQGNQYVDYGCGKDTTIYSYCLDVLGNPIKMDSISFYIKGLDSDCGFILYPIYDTVLVGMDTVVTYEWIQGGIDAVVQIEDTCKCKQATLTTPDGESRLICGDLYIRNDCVGGIQPYWDGNTLVIHAGCNSNGGGSSYPNTGGITSPSPFTSPGLMPTPGSNNSFPSSASFTNYINLQTFQTAILNILGMMDSTSKYIQSISPSGPDCCDSVTILNQRVVGLENQVDKLNDSLVAVSAFADQLEYSIDSLKNNCCVIESAAIQIPFAAIQVDDNLVESVVIETGAADVPVAITNWNTHPSSTLILDTANGIIEFAASDTGVYLITGSLSATADKVGVYHLFAAETGGGNRIPVAMTFTIDTLGQEESGSFNGVITIDSPKSFDLNIESTIENTTVIINHMSVAFTKLR